jgi:hypothetical protein
MTASPAPTASSPSFDSFGSSGSSGEPRFLRPALLVLLIVCASAALLGGFALVLSPAGVLGLELADLRAFKSYRIPGLLLATLGVLHLTTAVLLARRATSGTTAATVAGFGLVLWMAFQSALVIPLHPLQLVALLTGMTIFTLAGELANAEHEAGPPLRDDANERRAARPGIATARA